MNFDEIQKGFITEAMSAPTLFSDLSKIELYISESYRTRAFTELLQNADDAKATKFIIRYTEDNQLIVANNGNEFTPTDLISLCRSGASNKKRSSGDTIGYRGIGFKSLAGIAKEITVLSGEFSFKFSKPITKKILNLNQDVPLIRIPHYTEKYTLSEYISDLKKTEELTTVFILSELDFRILMDEIDSFDENSLLFINSVKEISIDLPSIKRNIRKKINNLEDLDYFMINSIESEKNVTKWLVAEKNKSYVKIAFKYEDNIITPCSLEDSIIHSFLPTQESSGAYLKFNGDFSTDPSRKSIDLDDLSKKSFNECCVFLSEILNFAINNGSLQGILTTIISDTPINSRFRRLLREQFIEYFEKNGIDIPNLGRIKISELKLPPEWININDYVGICSNHPHIPISLLNTHPDIIKFFKWLGAKSLNVLDSLELLKKYQLSPIGCIQLITQFIKQFRYDMKREYITRISSVPIIPTKFGTIPPNKYAGEELDEKFFTYIEKHMDEDELDIFLKTLKLPKNLFDTKSKNIDIILPEKKHNFQSTPTPARFPEIKKWRSAELNAVIWFQSLKEVLSVQDVSKANIGYDLEVLLVNGKKYFVEVKSVKSFYDSFRMTNNEHATAFKCGDSYLLAFVINSDDFDLKIIKNPLSNLNLEKRCEQWSWVCNDYAEHLMEFLE